eukprot:GHRR01015211.1.p1 GENE.GHRR01015211.1~~GHRR01015211.1.p1  ORF type:complete len:664 (+),score=177.73 GHRR01015211.1:545-2536(+)
MMQTTSIGDQAGAPAAACCTHAPTRLLVTVSLTLQPFFCVEPGAPFNTTRPNATLPGQPFAPAAATLLVASLQGPAQGSNIVDAAANVTSGNVADHQQPAAAAQPGSVSVPRPTSANIVMTTIRPLNISVDEASESVWVDAGVITMDLLEYLSNYVTPAAPAGWTLGAFPWFVYQSIGGAVATETHGSSLTHKSLSNQVLALDVVLANGTRRVFANETDPFLMRAFRVSLGKLGVIARVQLRIVREVPVRRELKALTPAEFLQIMQDTQALWTSNGTTPVWMNETEFFWVTQKNQFIMVNFHRSDTPGALTNLTGFKPDNTTVYTKKGSMLQLGELVLPADAAISINNSQVLVSQPAEGSLADAPAYQRAQQWVSGFLASEINAAVPAAANDTAAARTIGVRWTLPRPKSPSAWYGAENMAEGLMEISRFGIQQIASNLTAEATDIYIKQPQSTLSQLQAVLYDQYEVSVPLAAAGTCWAKLLQVVYQGDLLGTNPAIRALDKGLRTAPLIRFLGAEDGLLSHTYDGPRMYLNIEDYLYYNRGRKTNEKFKAVMAVLTGDPACTSMGPVRLHWGKAGWPDPGCWHGDAMYGDNWCHFGCAVKTLDPSDKFADSAPDRWNWEGVDLDKCCGPMGFTVGVEGCQCKVNHKRSMEQCPPAPFYTYR